MKRWLFLIVASTCMLTAQVATAQSPYAPQKASISDIIKPATYERVPIKLPEFQLVNTRMVVNKKRLDFELSYEVDYWELVEWFEAQWKAKKFVSILDPNIFPNANAPELRVYGKSGSGDFMKFTLGNPELPYRFDIRVRPDEQSKAVVVVQNAIYSVVYSGLMPARASFKPAGKTKEIPFRWN